MIFVKFGFFTTITKSYCWVKINVSSQLTSEPFYMYSFNFKIHILFFLPLSLIQERAVSYSISKRKLLYNYLCTQYQVYGNNNT